MWCTLTEISPVRYCRRGDLSMRHSKKGSSWRQYLSSIRRSLDNRARPNDHDPTFGQGRNWMSRLTPERTSRFGFVRTLAAGAAVLQLSLAAPALAQHVTMETLLDR